MVHSSCALFGPQRNYTQNYIIYPLFVICFELFHFYINHSYIIYFFICNYMRNSFGEVLIRSLLACVQPPEMSITISLTFLSMRFIYICIFMYWYHRCDTAMSWMKFVSHENSEIVPTKYIRLHWLFEFWHRNGQATEQKKNKNAKKLIRSKYVVCIALKEKKPHCSLYSTPTVICASYLIEMISGYRKDQKNTEKS